MSKNANKVTSYSFYFVWIKMIPSQQTQSICIAFIQRQTNVFGVVPTLLKYYTNVLWLLEYDKKYICNPQFSMDLSPVFIHLTEIIT